MALWGESRLPFTRDGGWLPRTVTCSSSGRAKSSSFDLEPGPSVVALLGEGLEVSNEKIELIFRGSVFTLLNLKPLLIQY